MSNEKKEKKVNDPELEQVSGGVRREKGDNRVVFACGSVRGKNSGTGRIRKENGKTGNKKNRTFVV